MKKKINITLEEAMVNYVDHLAASNKDQVNLIHGLPQNRSQVIQAMLYDLIRITISLEQQQLTQEMIHTLDQKWGQPYREMMNDHHKAEGGQR